MHCGHPCEASPCVRQFFQSITMVVATIVVSLIKYQTLRHSNNRANRRLAELGGHDPNNPILYQGFAMKQAISAKVNINWKRRYFIIRKDRVEYHWTIPQAGHIPRGVIELNEDTVVETVPNYREGHAVLKVCGKHETMYIHSHPGSLPIERWEMHLKDTIAQKSSGVSGDVKVTVPDSNEALLKSRLKRSLQCHWTKTTHLIQRTKSRLRLRASRRCSRRYRLRIRLARRASGALQKAPRLWRICVKRIMRNSS